MIKNLIFDAGGVLIGYRWEEMFSEKGISSNIANRIGDGIFHEEGWNKFDAGLITLEEIVDDFCNKNKDIEKETRWFIDNAILMRVKRPRVYEKLRILKEKGYKLFVLSNYSKRLFDLHLNDIGVRELMDGEVISYQIHKLKPEQEIYDELINRYSLNRDECIFFDDREENVNAAIKYGINAVKITDQNEEVLLQELDKFL